MWSGSKKGTNHARLSMFSEKETKPSLERNEETPQRKHSTPSTDERVRALNSNENVYIPKNDCLLNKPTSNCLLHCGGGAGILNTRIPSAE